MTLQLHHMTLQEYLLTILGSFGRPFSYSWASDQDHPALQTYVATTNSSTLEIPQELLPPAGEGLFILMEVRERLCFLSGFGVAEIASALPTPAPLFLGWVWARGGGRQTFRGSPSPALRAEKPTFSPPRSTTLPPV